MLSHNKIILLSFCIIGLISITMVSQAQAYSSGIQTIDDFRNESIDVYQYIQFSYTDIGTGGSHIGIIKNTPRVIPIIRIHTRMDSLAQLGSGLTTMAEDTLGSENRIEITPSAKMVFGETKQQLALWELGSYEATNYSQLRTELNIYETKAKQTFNNITDYWLGLNDSVIVDPTSYTGIKYVTALLPAEDIAYDWCTKNGAVLDEILMVNTSIVGNTEFVDFLTIQQSVPLEVDTNLDDGYDVIPQDAGLIPLIIAIAVAFCIVAVGVSFLYSAITGNPIFDYSTEVTYSADQSVNVNWTTPELNETQLYNQYLEFCSVSGAEPTIEGYYDWSRNHFAQIEASKPNIPTLTMNNNWTTDTGDPNKNSLMSIIGFIGDIIPIVITIIIIVAFIFGFLWIYRTGKKLISPE